MKSVELKPPLRGSVVNPNKTIFLAGSIEEGRAENWQQHVISKFTLDGVTFYNPRRDDWDSSWTQELNNPNFYDQVTWELDMLSSADIIFMYFDPTTESPISLLELGLFSERIRYAHNKRMIVCCPDGFWRKGNVEIVCQHQAVPMFNNMDTAIVELKRLIKTRL